MRFILQMLSSRSMCPSSGDAQTGSERNHWTGLPLMALTLSLMLLLLLSCLFPQMQLNLLLFHYHLPAVMQQDLKTWTGKRGWTTMQETGAEPQVNKEGPVALHGSREQHQSTVP